MKQPMRTAQFTALALTLGAALAGASTTAQASVSWHGTLTMPHFMANGVVLVYSDGSRPNIPSCGVGQPQRYAFDSTTPAGRAQLAGLLTAFSSGRKVVIVGNDTCTAYPDSESINYFYIED